MSILSRFRGSSLRVRELCVGYALVAGVLGWSGYVGAFALVVGVPLLVLARPTLAFVSTLVYYASATREIVPSALYFDAVYPLPAPAWMLWLGGAAVLALPAAVAAGVRLFIARRSTRFAGWINAGVVLIYVTVMGFEPVISDVAWATPWQAVGALFPGGGIVGFVALAGLWFALALIASEARAGRFCMQKITPTGGLSVVLTGVILGASGWANLTYVERPITVQSTAIPPEHRRNTLGTLALMRDAIIAAKTDTVVLGEQMVVWGPDTARVAAILWPADVRVITGVMLPSEDGERTYNAIIEMHQGTWREVRRADALMPFGQAKVLPAPDGFNRALETGNERFLVCWEGMLASHGRRVAQRGSERIYALTNVWWATPFLARQQQAAIAAWARAAGAELVIGSNQLHK
jgi:hypothetical protein